MINSTNPLKKQKASRISELFQEYSNFHRTLGNQVTHMIGIPMIAVSLLGLLSHMGSDFLNAGILFWVLSTTGYVLLEWKIGAPFSLVTLGAYWVGTVPSPFWLTVFFGIGWAFQLIGHFYFEKNRPALLTHFRHFWIGPLWLYAKLIQALPD